MVDSSGSVGGHLGALLGRLGGRVGHRAPISGRRGITLGQLKAQSNYLGALCELSWAVSSLFPRPPRFRSSVREVIGPGKVPLKTSFWAPGDRGELRGTAK
eukprot:5426923-Pyramimonas_sp.AAC.1